jgi:small neutral amino acid transporter SnatA (MarC family)
MRRFFRSSTIISVAVFGFMVSMIVFVFLGIAQLHDVAFGILEVSGWIFLALIALGNILKYAEKKREKPTQAEVPRDQP